MSAIIAVILPIYNQEQYLARALDSLAARVAARSEFAACLADVRRTSRLYSCRGGVKDLKYYLLFRYMIWRAR